MASLLVCNKYLFIMKWLAGRVGGNNGQEANTHGAEESSSNSSTRPSTTHESFPTPASLAEVMFSTRQMLTGEVSECLLVRSRPSNTHNYFKLLVFLLSRV